jgi:hypothetical protein
MRNRELSLTRRPVEAVFGTLKRSYRFHRTPYFNAAAFGLASIALHLQAMACVGGRIMSLATRRKKCTLRQTRPGRSAAMPRRIPYDKTPPQAFTAQQKFPAAQRSPG